MGDAFLVEFPSALEAVRCAFEIQRAVREFNISLPDNRRVHLRVGIHLGDVVKSEGDISGDAVNVASRIESLAEDGGVCLTRQVFDHVQNKFELPFSSLGLKQLKNVSAPLEVYRIVMPWEGTATHEMVQLDKRRVAVLPLKNLSPDPNDTYFADGMTEELITALSGVRELTVIASTSVMQYRTSPKRVVDVGRELGTGTILEGSVRKAGNRVRITVQMINAATEGHLWAQNYDRQLDDIFAIQSEIAEKVTDALKIQLMGSEKRRLEVPPTENTEAHTLYLKGRYFGNKRSKEALLSAIEHYEKAVALDPGFALAFAGLADCYSVMIGWSFMTNDEALPRQQQYALKAVQLDDLSAEAHTSLADVLSTKFDWSAAETEYKRAMELNPNYSIAHLGYGGYLSCFRRFDEALRELLWAEQLDPLSPAIPRFCARLYWDTGQLDLAEQKIKRALEIQPNAGVFFVMFLIHRGRKQWEECAADLDRMESFGFELKFGKALRGVVLAGLGRLDEARTILREISEAFAYEQQYENASHIDLCLALGEHEKAVQLVLSAYKRSPILTVIASEPVFESLRHDPRIQEVLRKVGLPA